ncbi:archaemetzincin-2-like [Gigantopelta aegis]|uniref:archaemetzincin-2-like n=1 Tax=Gigantopelta aegis TaxID=1735272 RepID=UPI001B88C0C2|nr:archaemetzincin-2-like [Gigantopelta aegis]
MESQRTETRKQKRKQRKKLSRFVPYASGFKPPSKSSQLKAIGFVSPPTIEPVFSPSPEFFQPVPHPISIDDWLAQYAEEGQTYNQFVRECPWFSRRKVKYMNQEFNPEGKTLSEKYPDGKVYIGLVGEFNQNLVVFDDFVDYVRRFLCLPVAVLPALTLDHVKGRVSIVERPTESSNEGTKRTKTLSTRVKKTELVTRQNAKSGHFQIRVDSILPKLRQVIPSDALCLITLTSHDLYGDNSDLFVAGMAAGNQRVAVFSVFRYDPSMTFSIEFWHQIFKSKVVSETDKKRLLLQRSCKLLVHEISHLLGIAHCVHFECCMNGSGHLEEDFRQPMHLCPVDLHKLQALCGFDALQRYESLLDFYKRHQMRNEAAWVERRLQFIKSTL